MKKEFKKKIICAAILSATGPQIAAAAFIGVDDECTLGQAIESANSNSTATGSTCESGAAGLDVILIPEQTISLTNPVSGDDIFLIDSEITIQSATHFRLRGASNSRIFRVSDSGDLTIRNATIYNSSIGSASSLDLKNGALIYASGGNVSLESVTLARGRVTGTETIDAKGGAVFMNGGELSLDRTLVINNTAGSGGAIAVSNGAKLTASRSVFGLNSSRFQGGVIFQEGDLSQVDISDSEFSENLATGLGGVIHAEAGSVSIGASELINNESLIGGGAVDLKNASLSLVDSLFLLNRTNVQGGAIAALESSRLEIRDSYFSRNQTRFSPRTDIKGGAIFISNGESANVIHSIVNSTFYDNQAFEGGDLYFASESDASVLQVTHSTIIANKGQTEKAIVISKEAQFSLTNSVVSKQGYLASVVPINIDVGTLCVTEQNASAILENSLVLDGSCGAPIRGVPQLTKPRRTSSSEPIVIGGGTDYYYVFPKIWNRLSIQGASYLTPIFNSRLLDAGAVTPCTGIAESKDQRGRIRIGGSCDIGSVEAKEAEILVDSNCSLQSALISADQGNDASDFYQCENGADLNTIRFRPNTNNGGFYDNILNYSAPVSRPTRVIGVSKQSTKFTSNGPIEVSSSGWLELSNATVDLNSGVSIAGYGSLNNISVIGARNSGVEINGQAKVNRTTVSNSGVGIVVNRDGEALITNSTISNNSSGGVTVSNNGKLSLLNSTVSQNVSNGAGAAVRVENATLNSIHSTISGNSSGADGGGIYVRNSFNSGDGNQTEILIKNSILAGNNANINGNELSIAQYGTQNIVFNIENNLIGDESSSYEDAIDDPFRLLGLDSNNSLLTLTDSEGGVNAQATRLSDVIFPLRINSGPTRTHAIPVTSIAKDAGDATVCGTRFESVSFSLDQQGRPRSDELCDIGSFEYLVDDLCIVIPLADIKAVNFCL